MIPDEAADVQIGDSLLMLSTSAGNAYPGCHFVVAARQVRPGESSAADYSGVTHNADVILPGGVDTPQTTTTGAPGTTATTTRPTPGRRTTAPRLLTPPANRVIRALPRTLPSRAGHHHLNRKQTYRNRPAAYRDRSAPNGAL